MKLNAASATVATRILGIDPGLRKTGFRVIDTLGSQWRYVASGCIKSGEGSLPERLKIILDGVREVIATYKPDQVAIEIVFVNVNPQSTLLLGQARGAAICGAGSCGPPVGGDTAPQGKQAAGGRRQAGRGRGCHMVERLLTLSASPSSDAADALACAICHAHASSGLAAMAGVGTRKRGGRLSR